MKRVRLALASAAILGAAGVFALIRADDRLSTIMGLALLLAAVGVAVSTWSAKKQRRQ